MHHMLTFPFNRLSDKNMLSVFHPFRICAYMLDSFISSSTTFCLSSYGSQSASTNNTSEGPSNSQVVLLTSSHLRFFFILQVTTHTSSNLCTNFNESRPYKLKDKTIITALIACSSRHDHIMMRCLYDKKLHASGTYHHHSDCSCIFLSRWVV